MEPWRLIVRHPWKYTLHENGEAELFQLEDDPLEVRNRAGDADVADTEATLREALLQWCQRTGDTFCIQHGGNSLPGAVTE